MPALDDKVFPEIQFELCPFWWSHDGKILSIGQCEFLWSSGDGLCLVTWQSDMIKMSALDLNRFFHTFNLVSFTSIWTSLIDLSVLPASYLLIRLFLFTFKDVVCVFIWYCASCDLQNRAVIYFCAKKNVKPVSSLSSCKGCTFMTRAGMIRSKSSCTR